MVLGLNQILLFFLLLTHIINLKAQVLCAKEYVKGEVELKLAIDRSCRNIDCYNIVSYRFLKTDSAEQSYSLAPYRDFNYGVIKKYPELRTYIGSEQRYFCDRLTPSKKCSILYNRNFKFNYAFPDSNGFNTIITNNQVKSEILNDTLILKYKARFIAIKYLFQKGTDEFKIAEKYDCKDNCQLYAYYKLKSLGNYKALGLKKTFKVYKVRYIFTDNIE
jgi:hypothetical protein